MLRITIEEFVLFGDLIGAVEPDIALSLSSDGMIEIDGAHFTLTKIMRKRTHETLSGPIVLDVPMWVLEEAVPVPGSRWEPESVDIIELSEHTHLYDAARAMLMKRYEQMIGGVFDHYAETKERQPLEPV